MNAKHSEEELFLAAFDYDRDLNRVSIRSQKCPVNAVICIRTLAKYSKT